MRSAIKKILKWDWGKQTYTGIGKAEKEFFGQSAPLWVNSSPYAFLTMFIISLVVFLALGFTYIFYIVDLEQEVCGYGY